MHFKVMQGGVNLATSIDQVAYTGLFLTGRALKWLNLTLLRYRRTV